MDVLDFLFMRIIAFLLGLFFLAFGVLYLYDDFAKGITIHGISKFGVSATGWGLIILFVVIKRQINRKNITSTTNYD
jgi:hypothetical protein